MHITIVLEICECEYFDFSCFILFDIKKTFAICKGSQILYIYLTYLPLSNCVAHHHLWHVYLFRLHFVCQILKKIDSAKFFFLNFKFFFYKFYTECSKFL